MEPRAESQPVPARRVRGGAVRRAGQRHRPRHGGHQGGRGGRGRVHLGHLPVPDRL